MYDWSIGRELWCRGGKCLFTSNAMGTFIVTSHVPVVSRYTQLSVRKKVVNNKIRVCSGVHNRV